MSCYEENRKKRRKAELLIKKRELCKQLAIITEELSGDNDLSPLLRTIAVEADQQLKLMKNK